MDVGAQGLHVHIEVPVKQIHAGVVPVLQMVTNALFKLLFNVKRVSIVVAWNNVFDLVSFSKSEGIEMDNLPKCWGAPCIICDQLNKFVQNALQISIGFVSDDDIAIQVHKELHALTFGQTCFANDREEK